MELPSTFPTGSRRHTYQDQTLFQLAAARSLPKPSEEEIRRVERTYKEYVGYYNNTPSLDSKAPREVLAIARRAAEELEPTNGVLEMILWDFFKGYLETNDRLKGEDGYAEVCRLYERAKLAELEEDFDWDPPDRFAEGSVMKTDHHYQRPHEQEYGGNYQYRGELRPRGRWSSEPFPYALAAAMILGLLASYPLVLKPMYQVARDTLKRPSRPLNVG
ncbi:MAG: hypothetical protein KDK64_08535 [Chlamydiia bacterium]|nr:hypothetical protein [Chlamydiia bacterium]